MKKQIFFLAIGLSILSTVSAQYWQQRVKYQMDIDFNAPKHQFTGIQELTYYNNSPDTLYKVFYHLYFNAFQPGSMMDQRVQSIKDPDSRLLKIINLKPDEIGYLHVKTLLQDGKTLDFNEIGTILMVQLNHPILPGKKTKFTMTFNGQVPLQTRRSGRDNAEEVAFSMSQWYPKLSEYDSRGWHPDPYIGREFYGVWGDFKVNITIDSHYVLGGSGFVKNPKEVKHGYGGYEGTPESARVTWEFEAKNVHDFMWAADKDYLHKIVRVNDKLELHLLYKNNPKYNANWDTLAMEMPKMFNYINWRFGEYPYAKYSIIQGGDGGMEYPMATLITGNRSPGSLIGVTAHELMHSWYQSALASNEAKYAWLDEGFTSYSSDIVMNYMVNNDSLGVPDLDQTLKGIQRLTKSDFNEPLSIHSDHYLTNFAYSTNAYSKGAFYLHQLAYVIGQQNLDNALRRYYNDWKFKHPEPRDFLLEAEITSGLELNWYNEYYVYTTRNVDYSIQGIYGKTDETLVVLNRKGDAILPVDLYVRLKDGREIIYSIPLEIMFGHKPPFKKIETRFAKPWRWINREYELNLPFDVADIDLLMIDPWVYTLDDDRENNLLEVDFDNQYRFIKTR